MGKKLKIILKKNIKMQILFVILFVILCCIIGFLWTNRARNEAVENEIVVKYDNPIDEYRGGNGTTASIKRMKGELYREYSIHLLDSYDTYRGEPYVYMDRDYSEIVLEGMK